MLASNLTSGNNLSGLNGSRTCKLHVPSLQTSVLVSSELDTVLIVEPMFPATSGQIEEERETYSKACNGP